MHRSGLVRKVISETVHPGGGAPTFRRNRTVWVKPEGKTDRIRAKGQQLFGATIFDDIEKRLRNLPTNELKAKAKVYKKEIMELNRDLINKKLLPADIVKDLKAKKHIARAKRNIAKKLLAHKKNQSDEASEDLSNFTVSSEKINESARARIKELLAKDEECKSLAISKITRTKPIGNGATNPEKMWLKNGKIGVWKSVKKEWQLQNGCPAGTYFLREICAFEVNNILGFSIVPKTSFKSVHGEVGSIQKWCEGIHGARLFEDELRSLYKSKQGVQMAIFDSINGNGDRHGENWLYDKEADKIWAIDNGLTFNEQISKEPRSSFINYWRGMELPEEAISNLSKNRNRILICVSQYLGARATSAVKHRIDHIIENKKV